MAAKILLFDIETAPLVGTAWDTYKTNILKILRPTYMLSFAWKWYGDKEIQARGLPHYKGYDPDKHDDKQLTTDLWKLFDEADIIVAQNGDAFDIKKANSRFLAHRMSPPSTYLTFDTLKALKKAFKFDSNRMNAVSQILGLPKKVQTGGIDLWDECVAGNPEAWNLMLEYNAHDVTMLENLYNLVRPWVRHPNVTLYEPKPDKTACPTCGSHHTQKRGPQASKTRLYQRYVCLDCRSWFQGELLKK